MQNCRKVVLFCVAVLFVVVVGVLLAVFLKSGQDDGSDDGIEVTISDGTILGEWRDGAQGRGFKFASFRGIPYAQPPIGELRFKGPKPPLKWQGVLTVKEQRSPCSQIGTVGSEDCLYLNVYTPKMPTTEQTPKMAVYFFIHGGASQFDSASERKYGPDFLVQQDIVVVTMNYRLGIMGSLSLDTEDLPGNAALKDQLQALRWVKASIAAFGGDPSKITVAGQSSGAACANWFSVLPQTKELIRSAIIQSGDSVGTFGLTDKNVEFAKAVYTHLTGTTTDDYSEIARAVKSAEYKDLFDAAENATSVLRETVAIGSTISYFYVPVIERRPQGAEEKLITKDTESYIVAGDGNHVPIMLGHTRQEWSNIFSSFPMFDNEPLLREALNDLRPYVPTSIMPGPDTSRYLGIDGTFSPPSEASVVKQLRDYFFPEKTDPDCNNNCRMAKFMHQVFIMADTAHLVRLRSRYTPSPTYAYVFNLISDYTPTARHLPAYLQNDVMHGDDMNYIWRREAVKQDYYGDGLASRTLRRLVAFIANFVKYGDPTPDTDDLIDVRWRPVRRGDEETFLEINANLVQHNGSTAGPPNAVWSGIFSAYRAGKSP